MKRFLLAAGAVFALGCNLTFAQTASVSAGGGNVSGSVSVPGGASANVRVGGGKAAVATNEDIWRCIDRSGNAVTVRGTPNGKQITVRSADGSSVSSASASGDAVAVAGSGFPGSTYAIKDCQKINRN